MHFMEFIISSVTLSEPVFWSLVGGIPASVGGVWAAQYKKAQTPTNPNGNGTLKSEVKVLQAELKGVCRRLDGLEANQLKMKEDISYIRGKLDKG